MAFADDMALMRTDVLAQLGMSVTLKKRGEGTLDVATGKKPSSPTSATISAIRGEDIPADSGAGTNTKRVYQIDATLQLTNDNAHRYSIVDSDGEWKCTAVKTSACGHLLNVLTEKTT